MSISYFSYLFLSYGQMPKQFRMNLDSGFSVIDLICIPSRTSLNESNFDGFKRIVLKVQKHLVCCKKKYLFPFFSLALRAKHVLTC